MLSASRRISNVFLSAVRTRSIPSVMLYWPEGVFLSCTVKFAALSSLALVSTTRITLLLTTETDLIPAPTVTLHVAFLPLPSAALAVMVALPSFTPFTSPLEDTVAIFLLEVDQAILLLTFFVGDTFAFSVFLPPTASAAVLAFNVTFLTAAFFTTTFTVAFFFGFFLEATVIFVFPAFTPLTMPLEDTVAILLSADYTLLCCSPFCSVSPSPWQ